MSRNVRSRLVSVVVVLFLAVVCVQMSLDPAIREIHKGERTSVIGLSNEFILGPLLGLQQAVAGLLWVRADEFFHEGDYDAILPIVRMVTWLDPHQLDVYITGAWHLAYNFTDSNERSDRRYIPAAQRLLEEGDANNPECYDIAFELGWQNTDKIKNYQRAYEWYKKASTRKAADDSGRLTMPAPMFVYHQMAHSLTRLGRIDEAIEVWKLALVKSNELVKRDPNDFSRRNVRDSERHNLQLTLKRKYSRYTHEIDWEVDQKRSERIDPYTGEPSPRDAYVFLNQGEISERVDRFRAVGQTAPAMSVGQPRPPATAPQWDTAFDAKPSFSSNKVLDIKGRFNVGDGARVTIRLTDEDWRESQLKQFSFNVNQDQTIMQDQHSVRQGTFGRRIDMSKDPKMYSFRSSHYYLVFDFDCRGTSPFVQDIFGWSGEGMTDPKCVWVDTSADPPNRRLRKIYRISRDQVMRRQPITEADVVPNEVYARIQRTPAAAAAR